MTARRRFATAARMVRTRPINANENMTASDIDARKMLVEA